jgi:hypothetical protein
MAYDRLLDNWAAKAGKDRLIVLPFEAEQLSDNDLISDFCLAAGIAEAGLTRPEPSERNELRLEARHIMLLREFNRLPFPGFDSYVAFIEAATEALARSAPPAGKPNVLNGTVRHGLLAAHREGNRRVAEEYLGRHDGVLFRETAMPPDETEPIPAPSAEEIRLVSDLYRRHADPAGRGAVARLAFAAGRLRYAFGGFRPDLPAP